MRAVQAAGYNGHGPIEKLTLKPYHPRLALHVRAFAPSGRRPAAKQLLTAV